MTTNAKQLAALAACSLMCLATGIEAASHAAIKVRVAASNKASFAEVQSIFKANCVFCHNDRQAAGNVNLTSYEKVMQSGRPAHIVIPRHPEKCELVKAIDGQKKPRMPFNRQPLSDQEIAAIKAWIKAGAKK